MELYGFGDHLKLLPILRGEQSAIKFSEPEKVYLNEQFIKHFIKHFNSISIGQIFNHINQLCITKLKKTFLPGVPKKSSPVWLIINGK